MVNQESDIAFERPSQAVTTSKIKFMFIKLCGVIKKFSNCVRYLRGIVQCLCEKSCHHF